MLMLMLSSRHATLCLCRVGEDGDFNQYWYSAYTIQKIVEVRAQLTSMLALPPCRMLALPSCRIAPTPIMLLA